MLIIHSFQLAVTSSHKFISLFFLILIWKHAFVILLSIVVSLTCAEGILFGASLTAMDNRFGFPKPDINVGASQNSRKFNQDNQVKIMIQTIIPTCDK